ncbi:MAG: cytochrome c [Sinobacteraceae bacterium]|nr:cytochrome c [Nevskiaceae bacterium]
MSAHRVAMLTLALVITAATGLLAEVRAASGAASGAEPEARAGEGRELFVARCSSCHSLDYMEMHARFGTRALWEAEVTKMRNAYKAPLNDEEAKAIVEYLARTYGPTSPAASVSR